MLHPDDTALAAREMENILIQPEIPISIRVRGIYKDGTTQWLQLKALNRVEDPAVNGLLVYISQIGAVRDLELERAAFAQLAATMGQQGGMAVFCFDESDRLMLTAGAPDLFFAAEEQPLLGMDFQSLLKPWGRKLDPLRQAAAGNGARAFKINAKFFAGKEVEATLFQISEQPSRWALLLHDRTSDYAYHKFVRQKPAVDKQIAALQQAFNRASTRQALLHRAVVCSFWRYEGTAKTLNFERNSTFALPALKGTKCRLSELEEVVHPEDWKLFDFLTASETDEIGQQQQFDCRFRAASGIYDRWGHWSVALKVADVHEIYGVWVKGTEENRMESHEQLTRSLSEVFSKIDLGWMLVEGEGQIWHINVKARELLALEAGVYGHFQQVETLSRTLLERQLLKSQEEQRSLDFAYFHAPAGRWIEVNIIPGIYLTHILLLEKSQ